MRSASVARCFALLAPPFFVAWIGCSYSATPGDTDSPHREAGPRDPVHDFGTVLASGETLLQHKFVLENPTDRPIRLEASAALTPCCSTIGPAPETIPAHGSIQVPVSFRPGRQADRKRVEFLIRTDEELSPIWRVAVVASVVHELATRVERESDLELPVGRTGRQIPTIACRRLGDAGRGEPVSVQAFESLAAGFVGSAETLKLPGGIIETTRRVEVTLPASSRDGNSRGQVTFRWENGQSWDCPVTWRVRPLISALPAGISLKPGGQSSWTVLLRATDRPFRVCGVDGPACLDSWERTSAETATLHTVILRFDPDKARPGEVANIRFLTDEPDQTEVLVSVLATKMDGSGSGS